jgi:ribosomal protein S21
MVEVYKRDNESTESLLRRFSRVVQQSGVLLQAKKVRFHTRKKGRRKMREDAIRRVQLQSERERLIKLGEIDEFAPPQRGRGRWPRS